MITTVTAMLCPTRQMRRPMRLRMTARDAAINTAHIATTTGRANALLQVNATQLFVRERGMQFSVTSIDPAAQIIYDPSDRFSSPYMNALYRHGFERAQGGGLWADS
ncbi:hypothetical protein SAMN04489759_104255 [Sulfitobacter delicatus]|uniref:Uncharacterized protein n=1 Tax=Sulfitobacter delicatus TaxID=218672 RepID=A0A1G7R3E4_9RHOB|nr:hypothetical protein SAMN04489759_104255 [Sulfitobacter delicatus]